MLTIDFDVFCCHRKELELRIETQKQTLAARDESIKKLLEMLQNKGMGKHIVPLISIFIILLSAFVPPSVRCNLNEEQ